MSSEVMETLLCVCVSECEYLSLRYRMVRLDKVSDEISIIQYGDIMTDHLRVLDLQELSTLHSNSPQTQPASL